jgi:hypothetical protein
MASMHNLQHLWGVSVCFGMVQLLPFGAVKTVPYLVRTHVSTHALCTIVCARRGCMQVRLSILARLQP